MTTTDIKTYRRGPVTFYVRPDSWDPDPYVYIDGECECGESFSDERSELETLPEYLDDLASDHMTHTDN